MVQVCRQLTKALTLLAGFTGGFSCIGQNAAIGT